MFFIGTWSFTGIPEELTKSQHYITAPPDSPHSRHSTLLPLFPFLADIISTDILKSAARKPGETVEYVKALEVSSRPRWRSQFSIYMLSWKGDVSFHSVLVKPVFYSFDNTHFKKPLISIIH